MIKTEIRNPLNIPVFPDYQKKNTRNIEHLLAVTKIIVGSARNCNRAATKNRLFSRIPTTPYHPERRWRLKFDHGSNLLDAPASFNRSLERSIKRFPNQKPSLCH